MEVNMHNAKTNLSKLIAAAESGEDIVISRAGKPAVRLVVVAQPASQPRSQMLGAGVEKIRIADDWDSSETNLEIQRLFEAEGGKEALA